MHQKHYLPPLFATKSYDDTKNISKPDLAIVCELPRRKFVSFDDTYNGCCFLDKQGTRLSDDQNLPHLARRAKVEVYVDSG